MKGLDTVIRKGIVLAFLTCLAVIQSACGGASNTPPASAPADEPAIGPEDPAAPNDVDTDGDGIPDRCDDCPDDPENFNSCMDWDGCHEHCYPTGISGEVGFFDTVDFEVGSAEPRGTETTLLESFAATLLGNPQVERVACVGRASTTETRGHALSERRARAVCAALEDHGIAPERLEARGIGASDPLATGPGRGDDSRQRTVELLVLVRDGTVRARWTGRRYERLAEPTPEPAPAPPQAPPMEWRPDGCPVRPPGE